MPQERRSAPCPPGLGSAAILSLYSRRRIPDAEPVPYEPTERAEWIVVIPDPLHFRLRQPGVLDDLIVQFDHRIINAMGTRSTPARGEGDAVLRWTLRGFLGLRKFHESVPPRLPLLVSTDLIPGFRRPVVPFQRLRSSKTGWDEKSVRPVYEFLKKRRHPKVVPTPMDGAGWSPGGGSRADGGNRGPEATLHIVRRLCEGYPGPSECLEVALDGDSLVRAGTGTTESERRRFRQRWVA